MWLTSWCESHTAIHNTWHHTTSHHMTWHRMPSHDMPSQIQVIYLWITHCNTYITWHHITHHHITQHGDSPLNHTMQYIHHTTPHHTTSHHITSYHITSHDITRHDMTNTGDSPVNTGDSHQDVIAILLNVRMKGHVRRDDIAITLRCDSDSSAITLTCHHIAITVTCHSDSSQYLNERTRQKRRDKQVTQEYMWQFNALNSTSLPRFCTSSYMRCVCMCDVRVCARMCVYVCMYACVYSCLYSCLSI